MLLSAPPFHFPSVMASISNGCVSWNWRGGEIEKGGDVVTPLLLQSDSPLPLSHDRAAVRHAALVICKSSPPDLVLPVGQTFDVSKSWGKRLRRLADSDGGVFGMLWAIHPRKDTNPPRSSSAALRSATSAGFGMMSWWLKDNTSWPSILGRQRAEIQCVFFRADASLRGTAGPAELIRLSVVRSAHERQRKWPLGDVSVGAAPPRRHRRRWAPMLARHSTNRRRAAGVARRRRCVGAPAAAPRPPPAQAGAGVRPSHDVPLPWRLRFTARSEAARAARRRRSRPRPRSPEHPSS